MNKTGTIIFTILMLIGVTGIMLASPESSVPLPTIAQNQPPQNYSGPFFGQKPEDVRKAYQDMVKDAEQQKADAAKSDKKGKAKAAKGMPSSPTQPEHQSTESGTAESPAVQPAATEAAQPTQQPSQPTQEPQDFMRGY